MIGQSMLVRDLCSRVSRCPAADPVLFGKDIGHTVLLQKISGEDSRDASSDDQDLCPDIAFQRWKDVAADSFIPE